MPVKVLAFFDARFHSRPAAGVTADDIWRSVLVPPLGQFQPPVGIPSAFGTYDLAIAAHARTVIDAAKATGIDGFVVDCRKGADGIYARDADVFATMQGSDFEFGFRWWNEASADLDRQRADAEAAVQAMAACAAVRSQGRVVVVVNAIERLDDPAAFVAVVRTAAAAVGLPRLTLIANRIADPAGDLVAAGFDALVDPDPSEWHSCASLAKPTGLDFFEVTAGLKDSALIADKRFAYDHFVNSRLTGRRRRGKILPRVFATFTDWPQHPYEGSTTLVAGNVKIYKAFIETSMVWVASRFPPDAQLVFLDSWNDRRRGSEIEPSTRSGDALLNATRQGIDRGRYVLRTGSVGATVVADPRRAEERNEEIEAMCRSVAAELDAEAQADADDAVDPTPAYPRVAPQPASMNGAVPFSIVLPTIYGPMVVNRHDVNQTGALLATGRAPDHAEIAVLGSLLAELGPDPVVIDVGANFGCFALALARIAGPKGKVHAFEAQRVIFDMLCGSVALNGLTQVFCHHVAVGDREGMIEVPQFDYDKRMNFGSVEFGGVQRERLDQARGHDALRREYVRMAALDGFGFDRVDLMKIDAEGMELEVLAGAAGIIGRCRPVILAEYLKVNRRKLREALSVYGYDLFTLGFNYLCVPPALQGRFASA